MEALKPQALLFDLDGTLFRTESLLIPAYHQTFDTLREEGLYAGETPPEERILQSLGLLLDEIWERVIPEFSYDTRQRANELLLMYQLEGLQQGEGELYPDVKNTLMGLHERGYNLFVASNGLEGYVKGVIEANGLSPVFSGLYSAGEYQTETKVELVRMLMENHGLQSAWMVGDRSSDVEAGKGNQLFTVYCDYAGFGHSNESNGADWIITSFADLLTKL